jgi:hypothetical protein
VTPLKRKGNATQALTSDSKMTPAAMKISRSRSGKAWPAPIEWSGFSPSARRVLTLHLVGLEPTELLAPAVVGELRHAD